MFHREFTFVVVVVITIRREDVEFYLMRARLLKLSDANVVEQWAFQSLCGSNAEMRIELQHPIHQLDKFRVDVLEHIVQL